VTDSSMAGDVNKRDDSSFIPMSSTRIAVSHAHATSLLIPVYASLLC